MNRITCELTFGEKEKICIAQFVGHRSKTLDGFTQASWSVDTGFESGLWNLRLYRSLWHVHLRTDTPTRATKSVGGEEWAGWWLPSQQRPANLFVLVDVWCSCRGLGWSPVSSETVFITHFHLSMNTIWGLNPHTWLSSQQVWRGTEAGKVFRRYWSLAVNSAKTGQRPILLVLGTEYSGGSCTLGQWAQPKRK